MDHYPSQLFRVTGLFWITCLLSKRPILRGRPGEDQRLPKLLLLLAAVELPSPEQDGKQDTGRKQNEAQPPMFCGPHGKKRCVAVRYTARGRRRSRHNSLHASGSIAKIRNTITSCFPMRMNVSMTVPPCQVIFVPFPTNIIPLLKFYVKFSQEYEVNHYRDQDSERSTQAQGDHLFWPHRASILLLSRCRRFGRRSLPGPGACYRERHGELGLHPGRRACGPGRIFPLQRYDPGAIPLGRCQVGAAFCRGPSFYLRKFLLYASASKGGPRL